VALGVADAVSLGVAVSVGLVDAMSLGVVDGDGDDDGVELGVGLCVGSGAVSGIEVGTQSSAEPSVGAATATDGMSLGSGLSVGSVSVAPSDGSAVAPGVTSDGLSPDVRSVFSCALAPGVGVGPAVCSSVGCVVGDTHGAELFAVGTADAVVLGVGVGEAVCDLPGVDVGDAESAGTALVSNNTGAPMVRALSAAARNAAPSAAAASTTTGALSNNWVDSPAVTSSGSAPPTTVEQSVGRCSDAATPFADRPCCLSGAPESLPPQPARASATTAQPAAARNRRAFPNADPVDTPPPP
jgi:hypothetical protein